MAQAADKEEQCRDMSQPLDDLRAAISAARAQGDANLVAILDSLQTLIPITTQEVHVYLHADPIVVDLNLTTVTPPPPPPPVAVRAVLNRTKGADNMPTQITVDQSGSALLEFLDDKGDTTAAAPAGAVITFTSDTPAVATVAPDASNPLLADIVGVTPGTASISATITDASGAPLLEPDGVTPFAVTPVAVTVDAGLAVSATLVQQ